MKSKYVLLDAVITVISGQTFTINQFLQFMNLTYKKSYKIDNGKIPILIKSFKVDTFPCSPCLILVFCVKLRYYKY